MKTAPRILEDRTQGSDQWKAEARTADAVREHVAGILSRDVQRNRQIYRALRCCPKTKEEFTPEPARVYLAGNITLQSLNKP